MTVPCLMCDDNSLCCLCVSMSGKCNDCDVCIAAVENLTADLDNLRRVRFMQMRDTIALRMNGILCCRLTGKL